jgi:hypothetical protein
MVNKHLFISSAESCLPLSTVKRATLLTQQQRDSEMAIIYDESARGNFSNVSIGRMDGTKAYLRHFENKLYLGFIAKNGTRDEKWQAEKELAICERKLSFWEKHPNFVADTAKREMEKLKKNWTGRGAA